LGKRKGTENERKEKAKEEDNEENVESRKSEP
jgi:hypothetical protein